jgi:hypothetical protein
MFARQIQKEVKVGDESVVVRKLSGKSLDRARVARRSDQVQGIRELGADLIKAFREGKEASGIKEAEAQPVQAETPELTPEEKAKARKALFEDYDKYVVLQAGIVSWTAQEKGKPVPVNADTIADLTAEEVDQISSEILDLSLAADAESARGNA